MFILLLATTLASFITPVVFKIVLKILSTSDTFNSIPFFKREVYSATEIRNRILTDHNWRELVPKSVSNIIDSIKGVERMMTLLHTDNPTI